jgi:hypothetical protein
MLETPFSLWILVILLGVVGSITTLATILLIFLRELKKGELW